MSLQFLYRARDLSFTEDLGTSAVRLGNVVLTMSAELGDIGSCSLTIDDPTGNSGHSGDQIVGWHRLIVIESDAPSGNRTIFDGFTQDRTYEIADSLITGEAVRITMELSDANHIASVRTITSTDGNRPAESVGARLTWLIASDYSPAADNGLVIYPTTMMDPADYRNQTCDSVLSDCAEAVGYNYFIYRDDVADRCLFFDNSNTSTAYTSSLRISNVLSEVDSNLDDGDGATHTWAPLKTISLKRSPKTVASKVILPYANGTVSVRRAATEDIFGPLDIVAADSNVKTESQATRRANRLLWEASTEEDLISCSIDLPRANVNDVREGQRMEAKFRQLPGYKSAFTWFRVLSRTVKQEQMTDEFYTVDLELSPQEAAEPATGIVQSTFASSTTSGVAMTLPNPVTIGNLLVYMVCQRQQSNPLAPYIGVSHPRFGAGAWTDNTPIGSLDFHISTSLAGGIKIFSKVADSTDNVGFVENRYSVMGLWEFAAGSTVGTPVYVDDHVAGTHPDMGSLGSPSSSQTALMIVGLGDNVDTQTVTHGTWVRDIYHDAYNWGTKIDDTISGGAVPYTWIGHRIGDGTALEADVTLSASRQYAGLAVVIS